MADTEWERYGEFSALMEKWKVPHQHHEALWGAFIFELWTRNILPFSHTFAPKSFRKLVRQHVQASVVR